ALRGGRRVAGRRGPDRIGRCVLRRVPRGARTGPRAGVGRTPGDERRSCTAHRPRLVTAAVRTASGTFLVDLETEAVLGDGHDFGPNRVWGGLPGPVAPR